MLKHRCLVVQALLILCAALPLQAAWSGPEKHHSICAVRMVDSGPALSALIRGQNRPSAQNTTAESEYGGIRIQFDGVPA